MSITDMPMKIKDVVLANPPWERIKLQEQEFFGPRNPEIANATTIQITCRNAKELSEPIGLTKSSR